jgi:hypothetical protein
MSTEVQQLTTEVTTWKERAATLVVRDQGSYEEAAALRRGIKAFRAKIAEVCDPVIAAGHAAHQAGLKQKKDLDDVPAKLETALKTQMDTYLEAEERERRRKEAELAAAARAIEDQARLEEALALEAAGEKDVAEAVLAAPPMAPAITLPKPTAEGTVVRVNWRFRITDEKKIPREYWVLDEKKIGRIVGTMKQLTSIPGVQAYPEKSSGVRG